MTDKCEDLEKQLNSIGNFLMIVVPLTISVCTAMCYNLRSSRCTTIDFKVPCLKLSCIRQLQDIDEQAQDNITNSPNLVPAIAPTSSNNINPLTSSNLNRYKIRREGRISQERVESHDGTFNNNV